MYSYANTSYASLRLTRTPTAHGVSTTNFDLMKQIPDEVKDPPMIYMSHTRILTHRFKREIQRPCRVFLADLKYLADDTKLEETAS